MKHLTQDQLRCLEVIRFFREDPQRWTKGTFARDENGNSCAPTSGAARQFCFLGAWQKMYGMERLWGLGPRSQCDLIDINDISLSLDDMIARVSDEFGV